MTGISSENEFQSSSEQTGPGNYFQQIKETDPSNFSFRQ